MSAGGAPAGFDALSTEFAGLASTADYARRLDAAYEDPGVGAAVAALQPQRFSLTPEVRARMEAQRRQNMAAGGAPPPPPLRLAPAPPPQPVMQPMMPAPQPEPMQAYAPPTVGYATQADLDASFGSLQEAVLSLAGAVDSLTRRAAVEDETRNAKTLQQGLSVVFQYEQFGDVGQTIEQLLKNDKYVVLVSNAGPNEMRFTPRAGVPVNLLSKSLDFAARIVPTGCDFEDRGKHYVVLRRVPPDEAQQADEPSLSETEAAERRAKAEVREAMQSQPDAREIQGLPPTPPQEALVIE